MTQPAPAWMSLDRAAGDLEGQIYRALRARILGGEMPAGQRLASTRGLALALGVARSTVVQAYDRLRQEGYLEGRMGAASRVAGFAAAPLQGAASAPPQALAALADPAAEDGVLPLRSGVPDLTEFPHAAWARCLAARARSLRLHDLGYGAASGLPALKQAILAHLAASRGVAADAEQLLVLPTTGAAIDLLARLVLGTEGGAAWIEEPGYPSARALLAQAGARLRPVPCDAAGLDATGLSGGPPPRLIYVTPSHQYPTGVTMSLARRLALLEAARAAGALILEDDYDSDFQYAPRPIAALQGIDRHGVVAYLGSISKVLAPGLRVAYAVLPARLVGPAREAQQLRGAVVPVQIQAALADFMREGFFRAHIRRMTPLYAERMAATRAAMQRHCGPHLRVGEGAGGLQLPCWFRDPAVPDQAVVQRLRAAGLGPRAMSDFFLGPPRPGLLLGIARVRPEGIGAQAQRIARLIDAGR